MVAVGRLFTVEVVMVGVVEVEEVEGAVDGTEEATVAIVVSDEPVVLSTVDAAERAALEVAVLVVLADAVVDTVDD